MLIIGSPPQTFNIRFIKTKWSLELNGQPSIPLAYQWCQSQCIMRLEGIDLYINSKFQIFESVSRLNSWIIKPTTIITNQLPSLNNVNQLGSKHVCVSHALSFTFNSQDLTICTAKPMHSRPLHSIFVCIISAY